MSAACDICREKPPYWLARDNQGNEAMLCRKCKPLFTAKAILAELEVQQTYFESKLARYAEYLKNFEYDHGEDRELYAIASGFESDFKTMLDRMIQVTSEKHYGRQPKKKGQTKTNNYKFHKPEKKTWQQNKNKKKR